MVRQQQQLHRSQHPCQSGGIAALARQAENALSKILAVLPLDARAAAESLALYAPLPALDPATSAHLTALREATEARRKLRMGYLDLGGVKSERTVRPLACLFWGPVWTVAAWCELRNDFRSFRVDRIETLRRWTRASATSPARRWPT